MLEGITVLNQYAAMEFDVVAFFGSFMIISIVGGIIALVTDCEFLFYLMMFTGAVFVSAPLAYNESEDRYRYECSIDESVSMTDVCERYEIIEQRGDIWVLEDKE